MLPTEDLFACVYVLIDDLTAAGIIAIPPRRAVAARAPRSLPGGRAGPDGEGPRSIHKAVLCTSCFARFPASA